MPNEGAYSEINKPGMDGATKMPSDAESGMCRKDIKDWSFREVTDYLTQQSTPADKLV